MIPSNKNLWIIALALCALGLAGCGSKSDNVAKHMEKARQYLQEGNLDKARIEFKNVIKIEPKNAQALFEVGKISEEKTDLRAALSNYLAAKEADPNYIPVKARLARIYLLARASDKAEAEVKDILQLDPKNPDAYAVQGGLKSQQGDIEGAIHDANTALSHQPYHLDATLLLVSLYERTDQHNEAVGLLEKSLEHHPKNAGLRTLLAKNYIDNHEPEKAEAAINQLIQIEPEVLGHRVNLAKIFIERQQIDEADQVMQKAVESMPASAGAKIAYADFLATYKDKDAAEKRLLSYVEAESANHELKFGLASFYLKTAKEKEAIAIYEEVIAKSGLEPDGLAARNKLAQVYAEKQNLETTLKLINEVLAENSKDLEALKLRGIISLTNGDAEQAIADIRNALNDEPTSKDLLNQLAAAHLQKGETDLAVDTLKRILAFSPTDIQAQLRLAQIYSQSQNFEEAIKHLESVMKKAPDNVVAMELLIKAYVNSGNPNKAVPLAADLQRAFPEKAIGYYLKGLIYGSQGDNKASIENFKLALEKEPDAAEPLNALVRIYLAENDHAGAETYLNAMLSKNRENFLAQNLIGEVQLLQGKLDAAEKSFKNALEINNKLATPYRNLSTLYLKRNDKDGAAKILEQGLAATGSRTLHHQLASLHEAYGDYDKAIKQYETMLAENAEDSVAANNIAMLLATYKDDKESLDRAGKLADTLKSTNHPSFLDTVGWVHYRKGEIQDALVYLEKALQSAPNEPLLQYHIGMVRYKMGANDVAKEHLKKAVQADVKFMGIDEARQTLELINNS